MVSESRSALRLKNAWKVSDEKYAFIKNKKTSTEYEWTSKTPASYNGQDPFDNSIPASSEKSNKKIKASAVGRAEIEAIQSIGRKSVNRFSADDIAATERYAKAYYEQMGAKSPFFRSWFGDWRVNDRTPVAVATKAGSGRGVQRNEDTGWNINVSGKVFNETKAHLGNKNANAVQYLPYINDIVKKAILLDSFAMGETKSPNSLMMHSFYAVANIGDGEEILKLYVEEMNDPNAENTAKRAYSLQNIERQPSGVTGSPSRDSRISQTTAIHTVADLFAVVKSRDNNFKPNIVIPTLWRQMKNALCLS